MAGPGVERRWPGRAVGAGFALAVHLGVLGLLVLATPRLFPAYQGERAISVDLVASAERPTRPPRPPPAAAAPKAPPIVPPSVEPPEPPPPGVAAVPLSRPAAPAAANPAQGPTPAGLALRNSIVGCAFAGAVGLSDAQRRHCRDMFAAGRVSGPELASLGVDPSRKAAFDAAADRADFMRKPFLSARPKNGCKPFVDHQQYASLGGSRDAYSVSFGCGKTF